jgi:hypothetical protein
MSSPIPSQALNSPEGPYTQSRIGVVTIATSNSLFVDVGSSVIEVAFLLPFTSDVVLPPAAGTVVQLVRQDASWVAVGRVVGTGSNAILNPSFEDSPPGGQPVNWYLANISGSSAAVTTDILNAPEGDYAAKVYSEQASVSYLYSSPIAVTATEVWSLGAFVGGEYSGSPTWTADAAIVATWYANNVNLYPTTSSADIVVTTSLDVPQYPPFQPLSGIVTAPVSGYLRVALRSTLAAGQALVWDNITARRV